MKRTGFRRRVREPSKQTVNKTAKKADGSINEQSVNLEPVALFPHVKVIRPTRASRLYERAE
jgi:hypothetical protein